MVLSNLKYMKPCKYIRNGSKMCEINLWESRLRRASRDRAMAEFAAQLKPLC